MQAQTPVSTEAQNWKDFREGWWQWSSLWKPLYEEQLYRSGLLSLRWRLLRLLAGYVRALLNCKWHGEGKKGEIVHRCKSERASNRKWQRAMRIQMDTFIMPVSIRESDDHGMRELPNPKQIKKMRPLLAQWRIAGSGNEGHWPTLTGFLPSSNYSPKKEQWRVSRLLLLFTAVFNPSAECKLAFFSKGVKTTPVIWQTSQLCVKHHS